MTDVFDKKKRSEIMSRIRSKNTKAERIVFKYLRKEKIYFQKHYKSRFGNIDIALPRKKKVVFIDGDFWHGRTLDGLIERKVSNADYWIPKIKRNMKRDAQQREQLKESGWQIMSAWESDITRKRTQREVLERIKSFLLN